MKIGLLGCGTVGSGVKEIIDTMNSEIIISKILVKDEKDIIEPRMTTNINEILNDDIDLIVECIGGIDIPLIFIKKALNSKKHVVTSNKKVMATHYKELIELAKENHVILAFEASVGGGIPWMENIRHIKRVDSISAFDGIFNGTTNYILYNMMQKGVEFDYTLKEAQALGYAESDPTDDIDGHDVKYKCCLSGNAIWNTDFNLNDIIFFGIRNISKKDIEYAKNKKYNIKLIGQGQRWGSKANLYVIPTFLKNYENIANVPHNLNCVRLKSEFLGESSYIGQGAGKFATAHAVVQDIVSIYENRNLSFPISEKIEIVNEVSSNFYIRSKNLNKFNHIIEEKIDDETIITKYIRLKDIKDFIDKDTFIAEFRLYLQE